MEEKLAKLSVSCGLLRGGGKARSFPFLSACALENHGASFSS